MKSILSVCLLTSVSVAAMAQSSPQPYVDLANELEIMSGVMATSFKQNASPKGWRVSRLESSYLAGQGAVFTLSVRGKTGRWMHEIEAMVEGMPTPPEAPVINEGEHVVFEINQEWENFADEATRHITQIFSGKNDDMRDIREQYRELEWEKREIERQKRDLSFELRQSQDDREKEIKQQLVKLESSLASLNEQLSSLEEEMRALEAERQQQLTEQKEKYQQAKKSFLAMFEASIGDTLCHFGAGLRGLPEHEHVSLVLKDFEQDEANKEHDRIYVFTKDNIKACVQERIDTQELLSSATVYSF